MSLLIRQDIIKIGPVRKSLLWPEESVVVLVRLSDLFTDSARLSDCTLIIKILLVGALAYSYCMMITSQKDVLTNDSSRRSR